MSFMRLSLVGPTGSGKSTLAQKLTQSYAFEIIKIARPLYEMQEYFYARLGKEIVGQDGELLQFLGGKIEKEAPGWLCNDFIRRLYSGNVVNDDCRLNCYQALRDAGFKFIFVDTPEYIRNERLRNDHTSVDPNHIVEKFPNKSECDYSVDNSGSIDAAFRLVEMIVENLKK